MRQYRVDAPQAHPVPQTRTQPRGPFPPELFRTATVVTDYEPEEDRFPPGATVQNRFQPEQRLRCRLCEAVMYESETADHVCPDQQEIV